MRASLRPSSGAVTSRGWPVLPLVPRRLKSDGAAAATKSSSNQQQQPDSWAAGGMADIVLQAAIGCVAVSGGVAAAAHPQSLFWIC